MPEQAFNEAAADPVAMAAINEVVEAVLEYLGPKEARGLLRSIASRVATPAAVIGIRNPEAARNLMAARSWMHGRLPAWMTTYG